ncbi:MAG: hypothetical protein JWO22_2980 [Frankiales bacterium]|nr:hypothetical protein [Frankiales bacterium]
MRTPLALIVPLALVAACSSGSGGNRQSLEATSAPTTSASSAAPAPTSSDVPNTATTKAPAAAATTARTSGTTTSTAAVAPLSTKAPGTTAPSKATAAGDYTYTSSGTVTIGTSPQDAKGSQTLTISPLKNGIQHSTIHSDSTGDTEEDIVVRDTGSYAASLKLTSPAFTKEFRPATPVLLMPDPAAVGKSWSWAVTSTDGATHATGTNKLIRKETLTIGGKKIPTVVLQTHLVLTGDVSYDAQLTTWWAPDYRLPVKTHTVGKGMYSGIPFKTDITAVMTSVKPH